MKFEENFDWKVDEKSDEKVEEKVDEKGAVGVVGFGKSVDRLDRSTDRLSLGSESRGMISVWPLGGLRSEGWRQPWFLLWKYSTTGGL